MKRLQILVLALVLVGITAVLPAFADAPIEGRIGRAELRFMEGMSDHHQMAIDMANDCLARTDISDELRTECQAIIDTQQPEIEQMQAWLLEWYNVQYAPMSMMDMMGMMGDMATMEPMEGMPVTDPAMMMGMMAGFNRLEGAEYEMAWLEAMIDHHDDANHMAERFLTRDANGEAHPDLRALAESIIAQQTEEIARFETMLAEMSGE